jgi:hypothetical protein
MIRFVSSFRIVQKLGFPALNSTDGLHSSWKIKVPTSYFDMIWEGKVEEIGQWTVSDQSAWLIQLSLKLFACERILQVNLEVISDWLNTARLVQFYSSTVVEKVSYPDMRDRIVPILLNPCSVLINMLSTMDTYKVLHRITVKNY